MDVALPSLKEVGVAPLIGACLRCNRPVGMTPVSVVMTPVSKVTNLVSQVTDPVVMEIWTLTSEDSGHVAEMDYDPCCDPDDL